MASTSFMTPPAKAKKAAKKVAKKATKRVAAAKPTKVKKPLNVFSLIRQAESLPISALERGKDQLEVWALNIAASTHGKNSQVLVAAKNTNGKSATVTIPDTWIPVCLTTQVSKEALLASNEFRAALAGNQHHGPLLRIIDTDTAYKILQFPEAQKEQQRLNRARNERREAQRSKPSSVDKKPTNLADGKVRKGKAVASGMVIGMTLNHKNGQLEEDQFINTLKANSKSLKRVDLEYMTANSASAKVKRWCAKRLGE